jgi:spore coat protein U-like protein
MKTLRVRMIHYRSTLALALGATAGGALAAGACSVSSSGLAFGTYQPLTLAGKLSSMDKTSTATVSLVCTAIDTGGGYTIALAASTYGPGNRVSNRYLNNSSKGGDYMVFNVYFDASYSTVLGNGTTGSLLSGSIPAGNSNQSQTVYGKVPAGQSTLQAGGFSDSLTMTITYNP